MQDSLSRPYGCAGLDLLHHSYLVSIQVDGSGQALRSQARPCGSFAVSLISYLYGIIFLKLHERKDNMFTNLQKAVQNKVVYETISMEANHELSLFRYESLQEKKPF